MKETWINKEDCEIIRQDSKDHDDYKVSGCAVLIDAMDGGRIFVVPETFTDEQIWECLRIANVAFGYGHEQGEKNKAREISKALFIAC